MKKRPGVLLYFDIRNGMKRLSTSDKGRLFDAILDYAENGVVPDFEGGLGVAWDFIVQKQCNKIGRKEIKPIYT